MSISKAFLKHVFCVSILLLSGVLLTPLNAQAEPSPIFNGKDLTGWKQVTGSAPYTVEREQIVGTAVLNSPNSFLCTEREYANFILEFEFWVDAPLNSGVMFRCHSRTIKDDKQQIYGYQMEIDPSPRAYTGGIYDEARRSWIYPLHYNLPAREAFRQGAWNKARIVATGNHLRTYINGHSAANLVDDFDDSGMICLQVHAISPGDLEGKSVRWKNITIQENPDAKESSVKTTDGPLENLIPNTLTATEKPPMAGVGPNWTISPPKAGPLKTVN